MRRSVVLGLGCLFLSLPAATAQPPKKEDVPRCIENLTAAEARVRLAAVEAIAEVGEIKAAYAKEAVAPLVEALKKDEDAKVRIAAAAALWRIDAEADKAVPGLIDRLKNDGEERVVLASVTTLGYYGSAAKEAVPLMKELNGKYMAEIAKIKEEQAQAKADGDKEKAMMILRKGNVVRQKSQTVTTALRSIEAKPK